MFSRHQSCMGSSAKTYDLLIPSQTGQNPDPCIIWLPISSPLGPSTQFSVLSVLHLPGPSLLAEGRDRVHPDSHPDSSLPGPAQTQKRLGGKGRKFCLCY